MQCSGYILFYPILCSISQWGSSAILINANALYAKLYQIQHAETTTNSEHGCNDRNLGEVIGLQ